MITYYLIIVAGFIFLLLFFWHIFSPQLLNTHTHTHSRYKIPIYPDDEFNAMHAHVSRMMVLITGHPTTAETVYTANGFLYFPKISYD